LFLSIFNQRQNKTVFLIPKHLKFDVLKEINEALLFVISDILKKTSIVITIHGNFFMIVLEFNDND
jgi:hypothetical protein